MDVYIHNGGGCVKLTFCGHSDYSPSSGSKEHMLALLTERIAVYACEVPRSGETDEKVWGRTPGSRT